MEAIITLSDVQRAFVQFCGVLQELILNHQVAHSVIQSLYNDLPVLQPECEGLRRGTTAIGTTVGTAYVMPLTTYGNETSKKKSTSLKQLQILAPRLTPTAVGGGGSGGDPSYRIASECQDNYIVLQNATLRSRDLLRLLGDLHHSAVAALGRLELDAANGPKPDPASRLGSEAQRVVGADSLVGGIEQLKRSDIPGAFSVEVDVELLTWSTDNRRAEGGCGTCDDVSSLLMPECGRLEESADNPTQLGRPAAASSPVATAKPQAVTALRQLSAPDLAILMGELRRQLALEVEMLGRIANSLELQTPSKDLYIYDIMLKLQPYMDERAVAAALAQRDLLEVPVAEGRQPVAHGKQS